MSDDDEPVDASLVPSEAVWQVSDDDAGKRLDAFLVERLTWRSRTSITTLIREGEVSVDGAPCTRKGRKLKLGERVGVAVPPPAEPVRHAEIGEDLAGRILFEDEHLIALDKPPGLVVHPVGRTRVNTLIQGLHWLVAHSGRPPRGGGLPRICHRLDRDTSGVLVLAKTSAARSELQHVFEGREVHKTYLAFVQGQTPEEETIDAPIGSDLESEIELKMAVRPDGLPSRTRYRVQARYPEATALEVAIDTGRQHQIRVHLSARGNPILGDPLYGAGADPRIGRQALHAQVLELPHPILGSPLRFVAPEPEDMLALREALGGGKGPLAR
ncbi:MAG: RluA family pseudouridine synthase [Planctomycetes bacterium]|nr:RluA family pseudouridine synthase [Planctomycetota bacterium]